MRGQGKTKIAVGLLLVGMTIQVQAQAIYRDSFEPLCAVDLDNDRLSGCQEETIGTDALSPDTDLDGLPDGDEILGTLDGLNLPALGVDPLHKDILLEIDWMVGPECGDENFSRRPTQENITFLQDVFSKAQVANPDGTQGINVIVDIGQGGVLSGGNEIDHGDALLDGDISDPESEFRKTRLTDFAPNRMGYFHYGTMAWRFNNIANYASGVAELGGDDLIVAMGCFSNDFFGAVIYSNTIAHELGHNLGLNHGGYEECNFKPNYNSVMNYRYQMYGTDATCDALSDYISAEFSDGSRPALDEMSLDEETGVCGTTQTDWNYDSVLQKNLVMDINKDDSLEIQNCGGMHTVLHDQNDWALMELKSIANAGEGLPLPQTPVCMPVPPELNP